MRPVLLAAIVALGLSGVAMAQATNGGAPPRRIDNIANGNDYQPTRGEVVPREKAAGIAPTGTQERTINNEVGRIDSELLRSEGLSTKSVPKLND